MKSLINKENTDLKQALAELYLRNDWLKKSLTGQGVILGRTDAQCFRKVSDHSSGRRLRVVGASYAGRTQCQQEQFLSVVSSL